MSVLMDMAREIHWAGGNEPEVWVLGELAFREWEADAQSHANYLVPPAPEGMRYQPTFMGVPITQIRSHYFNQRVELHSRDQMGHPQIKVVRW